MLIHSLRIQISINSNERTHLHGLLLRVEGLGHGADEHVDRDGHVHGGARVRPLWTNEAQLVVGAHHRLTVTHTWCIKICKDQHIIYKLIGSQFFYISFFNTQLNQDALN